MNLGLNQTILELTGRSAIKYTIEHEKDKNLVKMHLQQEL
jgi:hypothetical protein